MAVRSTERWGKLKDKLRQFVPEPTYQDAVDEIKKVWVKLSPKEMGEEFKGLKLRKIEISDEEKEINMKIEALSQLLVEWMEREEIESVRLDSGGVLTQTLSPYPRVVDEEQLLAWLREEHPTERLKLPWAVLERIVRERLEEGHPLPDGVEVFLKNSVKLYNAKG